MEMSSSMSGQWIPVPGPSSRWTTKASGTNSTARARACGGLTTEVLFAPLLEHGLVLKTAAAYRSPSATISDASERLAT